jgi:hypothetical protein
MRWPSSKPAPPISRRSAGGLGTYPRHDDGPPRPIPRRYRTEVSLRDLNPHVSEVGLETNCLRECAVCGVCARGLAVTGGGDRRIGWTTTGVGLVALIAATVSYLHMHLLVVSQGGVGVGGGIETALAPLERKLYWSQIGHEESEHIGQGRRGGQRTAPSTRSTVMNRMDLTRFDGRSVQAGQPQLIRRSAWLHASRRIGVLGAETRPRTSSNGDSIVTNFSRLEFDGRTWDELRAARFVSWSKAGWQYVAVRLRFAPNLAAVRHWRAHTDSGHLPSKPHGRSDAGSRDAPCVVALRCHTTTCGMTSVPTPATGACCFRGQGPVRRGRI